uniref:Reverse transcriptase domain-containing protein n=1 Tax=Trichuris muris TaxID=70415 RepID=A0A5S6QN06_TRIMR
MFKRYVDDIFVIIEEGKEVALLEHLNVLFPGKIIFTMEREEKGKLAFLDSLVIRDQGHIITKVFRKPTNSERSRKLRDVNKDTFVLRVFLPSLCNDQPFGYDIEKRKKGARMNKQLSSSGRDRADNVSWKVKLGDQEVKNSARFT